MLSGFDQWKVFWTFNDERGADLGSVWLVWQQSGHTVTPGLINAVSLVFFAAVCSAVLVLGLRARRTPRIPQLALLVVVGFLLVNKVYSPQYVLWLLPLVVLARPRWRDVLIWTAGEIFYFGAVWLYLGGWTASASSGQPDRFYWLAILVRVAAELYIAVLVVRDVLLPVARPGPRRRAHRRPRRAPRRRIATRGLPPEPAPKPRPARSAAAAIRRAQWSACARSVGVADRLTGYDRSHACTHHSPLTAEHARGGRRTRPEAARR